jgi:alkanesulfonate monooxygenase SsuD/methylene tetrahydromethanopterin reductase-like flavin-dependent oxidoreductase (luciferase family)
MAAALATQTQAAKIVLMGNCLPLHGHPVRLAEELAMLDVLSGGRIVSGFLRGGSREYGAYGISVPEGRQMFEEAWEVIVRAWTAEEPFDWNGDVYHYENIAIQPRPLQQPHPPIVTGANTAESIEWAARHCVPLLTSLSPTSQIAETFAYYRTYAQEECGWTPTPQHTGLSRHVFVGETDDAAWDACAEHVVSAFSAMPGGRDGPGGLASPAGRHTERSFAYKSERHIHVPRYEHVDFDQLDREGYLIVGSPETVTRKIKEQQEALGAGIFVTYVPFGTMEPTLALQSVDLFGREVLPHLH